MFTRVFEQGRSFFRQAMINTAHTVGLFATLESPCPLGELAERLGLGWSRLRALVDVLVLEGLLERRGGQLRLPAAPPPSAPLPLHGWGRLDEVLLEDRPLAPESVAAAERELSAHQAHLLEVGAEPARELARRWIRPGVMRVIDAGGGSGVYAAACLEADPELRMELVDRGPCLALAREQLCRYLDRVRLTELDLTRMTPSSPADLVLLVNVLHLHGPGAAGEIVHRCAEALAPGGRLLVKDLSVEPDRTGPPVALYFALNMAIYTAEGDVHDEERIRGWMADAGLEQLHVDTLRSSPGSLVLSGQRPAGRC